MENHDASLAGPMVADEFANVELGDLRRTKRLWSIAESWSASPACSVPRASKDSAETEATYRFVNNPSIDYLAIMEAHVQQTLERVSRVQTVVVAHDTSEFSYSGELRRQGLGRIKKGDQGFLAHTALAVTGDGTRRPLGVLGFAPWVRTGPARRKKNNGKKRSGNDYAKLKDKESARWFEMVQEVSSRVSEGTSVVHVMDREGDAYRLLWQMIEGGHRHVIRLSKDRVVQGADSDGTKELLSESLERLEGLCEMEVPIARRAKSRIPGTARTFAAREARVARLEFCATTVRIHKPRYEKEAPAWLELHVVSVREIDAPPDVEPIDWWLATQEPIDTAEQVLAIVEYYRTRWTIEEFFKALKTGCAVEKRQHESLHALLNVTAICLPIAWSMLALRNLARTAPDLPATLVLTPTQVEVLRAVSKKKLGHDATIREALYAVAALGGHLKSNGEPGWLVLARGMEFLIAVELGWLAARREKRDVIDD
jgi:hypothetical protein